MAQELFLTKTITFVRLIKWYNTFFTSVCKTSIKFLVLVLNCPQCSTIFYWISFAHALWKTTSEFSYLIFVRETYSHRAVLQKFGYCQSLMFKYLLIALLSLCFLTSLITCSFLVQMLNSFHTLNLIFEQDRKGKTQINFM